MNSEYMLTKEDIKRINERYEGTLRGDAEIETALYVGKGKSIFRKIAYLWRAVLVGHPFTDGNKRTALAIGEVLFELDGFHLSEESKRKMVNAIIKMSREDTTKINRIERLVRYVVEKD